MVVEHHPEEMLLTINTGPPLCWKERPASLSGLVHGQPGFHNAL